MLMMHMDSSFQPANHSFQVEILLLRLDLRRKRITICLQLICISPVMIRRNWLFLRIRNSSNCYLTLKCVLWVSQRHSRTYLEPTIFIITVKLHLNDYFSPATTDSHWQLLQLKAPLKTSQILQEHFKYQITVPTTNVLDSSDKSHELYSLWAPMFYCFSL